MSLTVPYSKLAVANVDEDKYIRAWNIVDAEVTALLDAAWKYDLKGKAKKAIKNYRAANYYIYLFHYAMNIDSYMERNKIDRTCISSTVFSEFKINCVQKNLPCISNELGGNYLSKWKSLASELKIELNEPCADPTLFKGEFSYCDFADTSFTLTTGTVTASCVPVEPGCAPLTQIKP